MTSEELESLNYIKFMALLGETNRPPGGKHVIREIVQDAFIDRQSRVLEVGCHTGFSSLEIHRLVGCRVVGLDVSLSPLCLAAQRREGSRPGFVGGDAMRLPFAKGAFDLVVCGGATAWMADRPDAVREYARVTRPWGRIAAVPFFYAVPPPDDLIEELNRLLGISIEKWGLEFWIELFRQEGLELYLSRSRRAVVVNDEAVEAWVSRLAHRRFPPDVWPDLYQTTLGRLQRLFHCFNRNNRYLGYALLIFRVRSEPEEEILFD